MPVRRLLVCLMFTAGLARADGQESQHADAVAAVWPSDALSASVQSFEGLSRTPPDLSALAPEPGRTEVPEPASAGLLLAGLLVVLGWFQNFRVRR